MKKVLVSLLLITVLMVPTTIMAQDMELDPDEPADPALEDNISGNQVIAEVNDVEITEADLNQQANLDQTLQQIGQMDQQLVQILANTEAGNEVLNEYQKAQLDSIIDNILLEQQAEAENISLSENEKEEIYQQQKESILAQNEMSEEEFVSVLEQQGFSGEEEYKEEFLNNPQLKVNKLLEEEVIDEIEVTEAELEAEFEANQDAFAQAEEDVTFEEVRPQLEEMIAQQKQAEVVNQYLEQLREEAEIEKNI